MSPAMDSLLEILLINGLTASLLALGVAIASRFIRRPSVVHALWVVVLLKLITPPVLEVGLLPAGIGTPEARLPGSATVALPSTVPVFDPDNLPSVEAAIPERTLDRGKLLRSGAVAIWFSGSLLVLLLALLRGVRFQRLLRSASRAPAGLRSRADRLADRMGLAPVPQVRVVPARISPMLWFPLHRLELLFPELLLERLEGAERDALVAHELAHARRRDHWVRYLELAAGALFWWHPVVWWARRQLREAEERSCDDCVLQALPGHSRAYAGGLLKTVEFLAGPAYDVPALASGAVAADNLKERLTMILKNRTQGRLSRPKLFLLALSALALLFVFPTRADRVAGNTEQGDAQLSTERIHDLEQQVAELQQELKLLHGRRVETGQALETASREVAIDGARGQLAELEARGRREDEEQLRRTDELKTRLYRLQVEVEQRELARSEQVNELEYELRRSLVLAEERRRAGDSSAAEALDDQSRAIKIELAERLRRLQDERTALQRELVEVGEDATSEEMNRLREEGRHRAARQIELELERARRFRLIAAGEADTAKRERLIEELLMQVDRLREQQQSEAKERGGLLR